MAEQDFNVEEDDFFEAPDVEIPEDEPEVPTSPTVSAEQIAGWRQRAENYDRFANDPEFARQVLLARAAQLGLQIQEPPQRQVTPQGPPPDYVEMVKETLEPQMQFLAPQIAKATWAATQQAIEPLRQQQQAQQSQKQQETYDSMARELASEVPGWEQHEEDMLELLNFIKGSLNGGPMTHKKHGSMLKVLYNMATGNAAARSEVGRRMQQAVRNQTRTSTASNRQNGPDLATMIDKVSSRAGKWGLAYRQALSENGVS